MYPQDESVVIGNDCKTMENVKISKSIIGNNVKIGKNVLIENSFIFDNIIINDNCKITYSLIGFNSNIQANCKVTAGSIIGNKVVLPKESFIENSIIQSTKPEDCKIFFITNQIFIKLTLNDLFQLNPRIKLVTKLTGLNY